MAKKCTICHHVHRWRIESLHAAGASRSSLAAKFEVSESAIQRHWNNHVSPEAKAGYLAGPNSLTTIAEKAGEIGEDTLDHLVALRGLLWQQLATLSISGDARAVGYVADKLTKILETIAKLTGELVSLSGVHVTNNTNVNIMASPEYLNLRSAVMRGLRDHPEARAAVLKELGRLEPQSPKLLDASPNAQGTSLAG